MRLRAGGDRERWALLPALTVAVLLWGGWAASGAAAPLDVKATLQDEGVSYHVAGVEHWQWRTYWMLHWAPLPGAVRYELLYKTSEGISRKPLFLNQAPYRIEVAKGDNPKAAGMATRAVQLQTLQGLLAVRVAPRLANGTLGPPSPWVPVGSEHP